MVSDLSKFCRAARCCFAQLNFVNNENHTEADYDRNLFTIASNMLLVNSNPSFHVRQIVIYEQNMSTGEPGEKLQLVFILSAATDNLP